ncbi:MAG: hypothetical protein ACRD3O_00685 [Terriglobia bacterium]
MTNHTELTLLRPQGVWAKREFGCVYWTPITEPKELARIALGGGKQ